MRTKIQNKQRGRHREMLSIMALPLLAAVAAPTAVNADDFKLPPITIGAGLRSNFVSTDTDGQKTTNDFNLNSVRLYLGGAVTDQIKFTFDTEYKGDGDNSVEVIDAIARFEFSPKVNIWAGRFLPPSDRSNLYGPYYANNSQVYTDGVQDGYPSFPAGRDNGVAYWGDFGGLKISTGVFDVPQTLNSGKVIAAGRVQYDFWDLEPGYYLNGTYYGEKNLLAVGVAGQVTKGGNAYNFDFLMERKLSAAGTVSVEAEYTSYDDLGGYNPNYTHSNGYYGLASYLFPQVIGWGKLQLLGKYAEAKFKDGSAPDFKQKTTEVDVNYVIKTFNARIGPFFRYTDLTEGQPDSKAYGVQLQLQI